MSKSGIVMLVLIVVILFIFLITGLYVYYYFRWKHLWAMDVSISSYEIKSRVDDTLKVVIIGDSWAGMHQGNGMDTYLCSELQKKVIRPVTVLSKGKGGEKSKGVYQLMFSPDYYGTKELLALKPDYCIISAGINDAAANLGSRQYCHYYRQILDFLLTNHIRPVVLEIPDVNIWHLYGEKPIKDLVVDFVRSTMTRCKMYQFREYRKALYQMLVDEHLMESVIYVPMKDWNEKGVEIDKHLFMDDQIHLNRYGYEKLDSCIALYILKDLDKLNGSKFVH
jgi:lysophospholipase L1-like esterase